MKKKLFVFLIPIVLIIISLLPRKENKELVSNTDNLVSFTVDGVESKTMPTKGSGYIANKITCNNGNIITFDNDNYKIEVEKLESEDACKIDFTKEIGSNTVTVTISDTSKIDSTSKTTTEGGKVVFYLTEEPSSISGGDYSLDGKIITIDNITSKVSLNVTLAKTLYDQLLVDNPTRDTRDTYDSVFTNNTTGILFTATEKNVHNTTDTTVYYYAGNTTNNWVKFGGFYWRIIRTNADGSIRLLYSGTSPDTTEGYIGKSAFNSTIDSPKYVGYMYGDNDDTLANARINTNNSTIKTAIDNWYASNMTSYTKYLSTTAVYCNDRNLSSGDTYSTSSDFYYVPYARVYTNYTPTYDCTEASDAFSVDNTSAKLNYPIALMTADEIMRAGGRGNTSLTSPYAWYYLNSANGSITGSTYWRLLSPYYWTSSSAYVFIVGALYDPGRLGYYSTTNAHGVRPAISLKSCIKYSTGNGTSGTPYEIVETSSGC